MMRLGIYTTGTMKPWRAEIMIIQEMFLNGSKLYCSTNPACCMHREQGGDMQMTCPPPWCYNYEDITHISV